MKLKVFLRDAEALERELDALNARYEEALKNDEPFEYTKEIFGKIKILNQEIRRAVLRIMARGLIVRLVRKSSKCSFSFPAVKITKVQVLVLPSVEKSWISTMDLSRHNAYRIVQGLIVSFLKICRNGNYTESMICCNFIDRTLLLIGFLKKEYAPSCIAFSSMALSINAEYRITGTPLQYPDFFSRDNDWSPLVFGIL